MRCVDNVLIHEYDKEEGGLIFKREGADSVMQYAKMKVDIRR